MKVILFKSDFITKIEKERQAYVASPEWRDANMDLDMMLADKEHAVQIKDIKKFVRSFRKLGISDSKILKELIGDYGKTFDKEDLEELMKEAK